MTYTTIYNGKMKNEMDNTDALRTHRKLEKYQDFKRGENGHFRVFYETVRKNSKMMADFEGDIRSHEKKKKGKPGLLGIYGL